MKFQSLPKPELSEESMVLPGNRLFRFQTRACISWNKARRTHKITDRGVDSRVLMLR